MNTTKTLLAAFALAVCLALPAPLLASEDRDMAGVQERGVLRHLGIPYANFVHGKNSGLDVELMTLFAAHLKVRYEFVQEDWGTILASLVGRTVKVKGTQVEYTGQAPVKGDLIANGMTILDWRTTVVDFSTPTFPTQVWLVARHDAPITPIKGTGNVKKDIALTREKLKGTTVLCKTGTCLDPALFDLDNAGAKARLFEGSLNDIAPAVILGKAGITLLDVPDALVALQKWPGKIKIIGPLTERQDMAVAFPKDAPKLVAEFNRFFARIKADGTYAKLVRKYYPGVFNYFPDFFSK